MISRSETVLYPAPVLLTHSWTVSCRKYLGVMIETCTHTVTVGLKIITNSLTELLAGQFISRLRLSPREQKLSVAEPVHFFRIQIRIRGSGFKNTDPDPYPTYYLDMLLMFSKINNFLWHFLTKSKHYMTLKIKDKKKYLDETNISRIKVWE